MTLYSQADTLRKVGEANQSIFDWSILIWTIRIALLIVLLVGVWIMLLYAFRYFKPSNIKSLTSRDIAEISEIRALGAAIVLESGEVVEDLKDTVTTLSETVEELKGTIPVLHSRLTEVEDKHQSLSKRVHSIQRETGKQGES